MLCFVYYPVHNGKPCYTSCHILMLTLGEEKFETTTKNKLKVEILQSMSKARDDKLSLKVRYGKVLICGAGAAGKTNFLNLLMEEDFQPLHISTEVAKPQQVTIAMKARLSRSTDDNNIIKFTKMDIDSEIDELMFYLPEKYTTRTPSIQGSVNESEIKKACTVAEVMMCSKIVTNVDSEKSPAELIVQHPEKIWDILTFMDTGGQPQFISMLPAVNNFAMITFIVHKMTGGKKSLTDKVVVKHGNRTGKDSFTPYMLKYTYHQLIKTLISYSSSVLLPNNGFLNDFKETALSVHDEEKNTTSISFIATHSSDVLESDIKEIDTEFIETIQYSGRKNIKPKLNTNYKYLVPIDSKTQEKDLIKADTNDKKYTDPSRIRNYIHKWLNKQDVFLIPIQWLLLELEIRKVCAEKGCCFISLDDVLTLSRDKNLGEDDFVKTGLRFHHLFGVLLFFEEIEGMPELIITDHQWLFDTLTEIVLYSFEDNCETNIDYEKYENEGIFKEAMLNKLDINADFEKSGINTKVIDPKRYLLKLLQHLRIVAPLNEDPTKYFMPSLLNSCDVTNLRGKIPGTNKFIFGTNETVHSEPLLIEFKLNDNTKSFPRGIFCFLAVELVHSTNWEIYKQAHDNLLSFIKKDTAHYITLIDRIFFLEVQVTSKSENSMPDHSKVFDTIHHALCEVGNTLNANIKPQYGFWCKGCENPKEMHISLLEKNCDYCYCIDKEPTTLDKPHMVWFKTSKVRIYALHN